MMSGENWLAEIPDAVREAITARFTTLLVPAGRTFRRAGDRGMSMYQVEEGYLKLHGLRSDGNQVMILIYKPGNCFGESPLVARRAHNHTTVALVDTRVHVLSERDFWQVYAEFPEVPDALCRKFANALGRSLASRDTRAANRLRHMVAMTFRILAEECGRARADGTISIPLPLTQTDFAEYLEVTRQAVQREIGAFKAAGVVDQDKDGWTILLPEQLEG